ncbi:MAG: C10 family peptidase [Armatimonadetes bacterium]|nr:C10 family peptidase [Armatimonadota bacterium]
MKTICLGLFLVLICSLWGEQVSVNTAQVVAENWFKFISGIENLILKNFEIMSYSDTTTIYIFNFEEEGFVITSASNDAEPILAYNDTGEILSSRSPGFEWLINCYNEQIYDIIENNLFSQENRITWQELYENTYSYNRTTVILQMDPTWSQGQPYKNFVPLIGNYRCPAGCGPIAMAQVINYHKYISDYYFSNEFAEPNYVSNGIEIIEIDEDHNEYDFPTFETLDPYLSDIRELFNEEYSIHYDDGFAALSFACGVALMATYATGGTGTVVGWHVECTYAQNFGYKADHLIRSFYQGDWELLMRNEIDNARIIHYNGSDTTPPVTGVHDFILHGYSIDPASEPCFYKVNWGWGGSGDCYCTLDNLIPEGYNYNFIELQSAIIDIEPSSFTIVGQLIDALPPKLSGDVGPKHPISIGCLNLTSGGIKYGVYRRSSTGFYYVQFDEQPPIGTEYRVRFTSDRYEQKTIYGEVTTDSNVLFMEQTELFWKFKPLYNGWNWESFTVLDRTGNDPVPAIPVLEEMEDFPEEITNIDVLNNGPIGYEQGYGPLTYDDEAWTPWTGYQLQSTRCYKIEVLPELPYYYYYRELDTEGTLLNPLTTIDLLAGQDNWIGYWIKATKDIDDAFGQHWDKIKSIKAEDWEWKDMTYPGRGRDDPTPYYPIRPLHYGKGYVVRVKEDIIGFQWSIFGEPKSRYTRQTPEFFTYEEKPDYEAIIVDSISGGGNLTEIGVFENDICVGASVIDSLPLQILAYTDAVNRGDNLTFQVSYGGGRDCQSVKSYYVLNLETGKFELKPLIIGDQEHNIIQLYLEEDEEDIPSLNKVTLYPNYPNPFNPFTIISFSIPEDTKVNLKVYNIKGQVVKTLLKEQIESGEHRITWDGKDDNKKPVASGIYFYKISAGKETKVKKMLLLK